LSTAEARYLKIDYDEVIRKLRDYAKSKAKAHEGVKAIVLTGSLAKGNYTGCSDADILIIADNLPGQILDRYAIFAEADLPVDVEPRAYSPEEFLSMVRQGDHFAIETLEVGVSLYGGEYFRGLKQHVTK
jgi:predicted nucleotidyltransferase